ncbi:MAG: prepilin-type N-terminal cleavage/methylation domain-containing protein [Meiothermus sp.]|nr:prepilin-type N-terminal cleavage/methylation domain-containing protein [Meiothermus sp.]
MKKPKQGYSLVEIIVVLAVAAILLSVGTVALLGYQRNLAMRQGISVVVADLTRARSQARKTSQDWQVVLTSNQNTYQIQRAGVTVQTVTLPAGVRIGNVGGSKTVQYTAPYGLRPQGSSSLEVPVVGTGSRQGKINVVGITGKVVVVE